MLALLVSDKSNYLLRSSARFGSLEKPAKGKIPGGVLPPKMGRGVRPASQNPYPIYE